MKSLDWLLLCLLQYLPEFETWKGTAALIFDVSLDACFVAYCTLAVFTGSFLNQAIGGRRNSLLPCVCMSTCIIDSYRW